jgi:cytochrome c-type biogenesis protein CcmE
MKRTVWVKVVVSVGLVLAAGAIIVYTASRSSGLFRFVDEVRAQEKSLTGREVWMAGNLEEGTHKVRSARGQRPDHKFFLEHRGARIEVRYTGSMPPNAKAGRQLVVLGKVLGSGRFQATEIRTKCPSKYKSQYEARK